LTRSRLLDSALEELRAHGFEGLTVRNSARRAGLAAATAYTHFSSKEHLVAELFWRLVETLPNAVEATDPPARRAGEALSPVAEAVASEPELARACTLSLLLDDPDVRRLRDQIAHEWYRRVAGALGGDGNPDRTTVLVLAWTGMLVAAGSGHIRYSDIPSLLEVAARALVGEPA